MMCACDMQEQVGTRLELQQQTRVLFDKVQRLEADLLSLREQVLIGNMMSSLRK